MPAILPPGPLSAEIHSKDLRCSPMVSCTTAMKTDLRRVLPAERISSSFLPIRRPELRSATSPSLHLRPALSMDYASASALITPTTDKEPTQERVFGCPLLRIMGTTW